MKEKKPKKDELKLNHGLHNEKACDYLILKEEYADWIVTTAFYSALQFVSYKIFPFRAPSIEGKTTIIETLDQYSKYNSQKGLKKHDFLAKLVAEHCSDIADDYDWLLSMSMTARYSNYHTDKLIAGKARTLLTKIKAECIK